MQDTEMQNLLAGLLAECQTCHRIFIENVALVLDDNGQLTDEQMEAIFVSMHEVHQAQHVQ